MAKENDLKNYHARRDFDFTSEPFGARKATSIKDSQIFVIQKHDASTLHYDFRLQINGVLKSWAIPKGPSTDPKVKRLAIATEDHPIEYADFEGTIPEGQYGGGTVMVWDAGTYEVNQDKEKDAELSLEEALKKGHATFVLHGKKIKGAYTLIRIEEGKNEQWLLKKVQDEMADARRNPTSTQNKSVLTDRTMNEIKEEAKSSEKTEGNTTTQKRHHE